MTSRTQSRTAATNVHAATSVPAGQTRECARYRGEIARHRVLTADGQDYVVATADERHLNRGYTTAAYPVARGYLVMMRQPLCVIPSQDDAAARDQHALLVRVLAEAGTGVVRARQRSATWRRAERAPGDATPARPIRLDVRDCVAPTKATKATRSSEVPA